MVQKPVNLLIKDTKDTLINVLNESGLPLSVMSSMLEGISSMVNASLQSTLEKETQDYYSALQKEHEAEQQVEVNE